MSYRYPVDDFDCGPNASELLISGGAVVGQAVFGRHMLSNTGSLTNGNFRASCFTARKSQTITAVRTVVGSTAQVGATLCRIGLYTMDSSDNATLVASTTNDTALWSSASATVDKALSSSYAITRGTRYAVGCLVVGSSTAPTVGTFQSSSSAEYAKIPRLNIFIGSQTDLPASILVGSMSITTVCPYAVLLP